MPPLIIKMWRLPITLDKHPTYYEVKRTTNYRRYLIMSDGYGFGGGFALIVVLFILLIIVGATWC